MTVTTDRAVEHSSGSIGQKKPLRADIQALRAFAVGIVILNHLWPDRLGGGFIGVDVFFVISGFLITSHLLREVDRSGRINLAAFWARRANRLLPAAMVVLVFTIAITAIWVPLPSKQSAYEQIGAAGVYVLNWLLSASSVNYFAMDAAPSPVTHYWSLSVEEQFYIVWPIVIALCLFVTRRRQYLQRRSFFVAFTIVLIGSLAWAAYRVSATPDLAYFETTTRAWEFAAGGLLAFAPALAPKLRTLLTPVAWAAWTVLALAALTFDSASGVPGVAALVPVLATGAIILISDVDRRWAPSTITSLKPIQWLGNVSYSAYLWHWPLIIAAPFILQRETSAKDKLLILVITVVVAGLSKRFIEDPTRNGLMPALRRPRNALIATAVAMAALLALTIPLSTSMAERSVDAARNEYRQSLSPMECFGAQAVLSGADCGESHVLADAELLFISPENQFTQLQTGGTCQQPRGSAEILNCDFGVDGEAARLNVALVGDSHADMWARPLDLVTEELGLHVTTYLASGCPATLDSDITFSKNENFPELCVDWRERVVQTIAADPNIDVVITSSYANAYYTAPRGTGERDSGSGYVEAWDVWLDAGKRVVVIDDVPAPPSSVPECIGLSHDSLDPCSFSAKSSTEPTPLARAAAEIDHSGMTFLNFRDVFCDDTKCHSVIGGIPAYVDSNHLSAAFARSFSSEFRDLAPLTAPKS